ncbi:hypothetical protein C8F04DRAFT_1255752 [Mycena alexandri]|uniref:CxC2-like cysteine cluster KDZ transposase-associated domain-containing protein n=1 Tax=Mycena alexandri TaxID=1745969 RepID=A0AAD6T5H9_9AGAR|nr:hypothetical protein C8F04DRAFT_1255752 [Mycena alexandri]
MSYVVLVQGEQYPNIGAICRTWDLDYAAASVVQQKADAAERCGATFLLAHPTTALGMSDAGSDSDTQMRNLEDLGDEDSDTCVGSEPSDIRAGAAALSGLDAKENDENRPPSLSQIDAEEEDDSCSLCYLCRAALGPRADPDTRGFRCSTCPFGVQCETCCAQTHLGGGSHLLQEWDHVRGQWGPERRIAQVLLTMRKLCGVCDAELAGRNTMPVPGTILCLDCGPKLLCPDCCREAHAMRPLHVLREWDQGWRASSVTALGLQYDLGHGGEECLWPIQPSSDLMVITMNGLHKLKVKYCGCGMAERGERGRWKQVLEVGWYRASLISSGICSAFPILDPNVERSYEPRPAE